MRGHGTIDLVNERRKLEQGKPGLVNSYREFVESFSQYREVEARFGSAAKLRRSSHSARPAALVGRSGD